MLYPIPLAAITISAAMSKTTATIPLTATLPTSRTGDPALLTLRTTEVGVHGADFRRRGILFPFTLSQNEEPEHACDG